jgi:hypothetical protein
MLFKKKIHRESASTAFMQHSRMEADRLLEAIIPSLARYCDGAHGRPSLRDVLLRPFTRFGNGGFSTSSEHPNLAAAHCCAIALATGIEAVRSGHVNPFDQYSVVEWIINERIVEEDVGKGNVGMAPSPWPTPTTHVQYAPGTFAHGVPSQLQRLVQRYTGTSPSYKAVLFLLGLKVFRPQAGIKKILYEKTELTPGFYGLTQIGSEDADPDSLDEWEDDLKIDDPSAALSVLPKHVIASIVSSIEAVDAFWPTYSKTHRLTW